MRLDRLSQVEMHQLAVHMDQAQVGGDAGVITILLIVILVLVVIRLL